MSFFERLNCFIICLEVGKLLFIFLYASIKARFYLLDLAFKIDNLSLLLFFKALLLGEQSLFVFQKLFQAFLFFLYMLLLQCSDLSFPCLAFLSMIERFLLSGYHAICTIQKSFHFFFICILNRCRQRRILFILAVQMEDDLRKLRDLLRHLMMCFFIHSCYVFFVAKFQILVAAKGLVVSEI